MAAVSQGLIVAPSFGSELITEDLSREHGKPQFELTAPLIYYSAVLQERVDVPVGFVTDFASIPQLLWNILPPVGAYDRAAVVHDFLYRFAPFNCTQHTADRVIAEAMQVDGVSGWKRHAIYAGLMVGGWKAWRDYRKGRANGR